MILSVSLSVMDTASVTLHSVVYYRLVLKNYEKHKSINIWSYIFILKRWRLCGPGEQSEREREREIERERERVYTDKGTVDSWNSLRKLSLSQNSRPYIVLKLPRDPPDHTSSPTQCLFSIGHGPHPRILMLRVSHPHVTCFPLIMA